MLKEKYSCDCNVIHEEEVLLAKNSMLDKLTINELSLFFKILGDPTRIKILWILHEKKMCVCDIANVLNMTKSSISHQLNLLRTNKIVKCERKGKEVYYTLDDFHIKEVFEVALSHINHNNKRSSL